MLHRAVLAPCLPLLCCRVLTGDRWWSLLFVSSSCSDWRAASPLLLSFSVRSRSLSPSDSVSAVRCRPRRAQPSSAAPARSRSRPGADSLLPRRRQSAASVSVKNRTVSSQMFFWRLNSGQSGTLLPTAVSLGHHLRYLGTSWLVIVSFLRAFTFGV